MSDPHDPSYQAYIDSLEPCPECGQVDEMDNITGQLLCAACYLDGASDDDYEFCPQCGENWCCEDTHGP